jgi:hypothetical protein
MLANLRSGDYGRATKWSGRREFWTRCMKTCCLSKFLRGAWWRFIVFRTGVIGQYTGGYRFSKFQNLKFKFDSRFSMILVGPGFFLVQTIFESLVDTLGSLSP